MVADPAASRHRLSSHQFAALAIGGGDEETVSQLLAEERSWRLLMLRAVLDAAGGGAGRTAPLAPLSQGVGVAGAG